MTVVVSFIKALSDEAAAGIEQCRVRENLAVGGTTAGAAQAQEMVIVGNSEANMIAIAFGSNPDAASLVATATTSAGIPVPAGGLSYAIFPQPGDKINAKAVT